MTPSTLFDKIWAAHEVAPGLIYIDLHLVHEVTSPQAFDGLRLADRTVRRPDRTLATADHNVPTDGTPVAARIRDELSRIQVETLERNCRGVRRPALLDRLRPPGHRARDRAGAGHHPARHDDRLRRLAHRHPRRVRRARVRHRHERGRARPRHPVPRAAPPQEHADQLPRRARLRRHAEGPDPRHDRPDGHRRRGRPRRRVRRHGHRGALDGGPDDDLQHDDRGRRPGRHDRARRHDVRVGARPRRGARGFRRRRRGLARAAHRRRRELRQGDRRRRRARCRRSSRGARRPRWSSPSPKRCPSRRATATQRALKYMGLEAGTPIAGDHARPRVHRLVHELADRRPACRRRAGQWPHGRLERRRDGRPRLRAGAPARPSRRASTRCSAPPASTGAPRAARCAWA